MIKNTYSPPKPGEEIVITGMSGKFPDSNNINHFRDNLFNKVDLISGDPRRWKPTHPEVPQRAGKMFDIDKFDPGFFGIPQNHAQNMDPMCRMILEKVYEALLDSGHHPVDLEGTKTSVYVGSLFSETENITFYNNLKNSDTLTGCQRSMLAKRISYHFKLNGVGFITDTASSSTLFAVDHAYKHFKEGVCEKAIICGTQLCLKENVSLQFARLGVLSPDGACKTFDDAANGYARSEAIAVIVLEKFKDAKRVYAEIIHSKTNCDGFKEQGITYPSSAMQKVLMKEFYEECQVDPMSLTYIEAHGSGTKAGDPEELTTLDIFWKTRSRPLHIGSVKSNIGHTEPVSGLCSIVKVLIGFEAGYIPPNINYNTPKKGVEGLEQKRLIVVTEKIPFPDNSGLVGVNNFGFGGGNGHLLLRWNPKIKINGGVPNDDLPRLVCASGRSKSMLKSIFDEASKMDSEFIKLIHDVFGKTIPHSLFNGFVISSKKGEIKRVICKNPNFFEKKLRVVFTNFDEEWCELGLKLMEIPLFSESIRRIQEIIPQLKPQRSLLVGFVTIQLAFADLIKKLNLGFNEIIGIGYGDFSAAYLNGILTLKEAILGTYYISSENNNKIIDTKKIKPAKNTIDLIIGPSSQNQLNSNIIFLQNTTSDPVQEVLSALGRLFLLGFPTQLDNLYPRISYPVSRGTPMISSLITWNHQSCTVHSNKNEEKHKNGQYIHISARSADWSFITGHVIDGRNLFPATGYLTLVWENFANIMGMTMSEISMVFEDVKFLRAANVPKEDTLTLKVTVQVENKLFEIMEGDNLLATGTVYPLINDESKIGYDFDGNFKDSEKFIMNEPDLYKELLLRGHHYSNQFKSIKKFNFQENKGIISWSGNWVTFMDNMFQIQLLAEDTRNLCVTTNIKKIVIDAPQHIKDTITYNNNLPVIYHKDLGIIKGGGIEIMGVKTSVIPRKKPANPILESYKFIPYHAKLQQNQAIRCLIQTIIENSNTVKMKVIEIINEEDEEPILTHLQEIFDDLPLIQGELKIFTKHKNVDVSGKTITIEDNLESGYHILIAKNIFENPNLLSTALKVTNFIISKENKNTQIKEHPQIQILSSYETEKEKLIQ